MKLHPTDVVTQRPWNANSEGRADLRLLLNESTAAFLQHIQVFLLNTLDGTSISFDRRAVARFSLLVWVSCIDHFELGRRQ